MTLKEKERIKKELIKLAELEMWLNLSNPKERQKLISVLDGVLNERQSI